MRRLCLFVVALMLIGILGCSQSNKEGIQQTSQPKKEIQGTRTKSEFPFPDAKPIGNVKLVISTPSGDSSDGKVPFLIVQPDTLLVQIGISCENFDGDKEVFFYINKIYHSKEQGGDFQGSFNLQEETLKPGKYTMTAAQFENNDPEKSVIGFAQARYEIRQGQ